MAADPRWSDLEARVLALRDAGDLDAAVAAALEGSRAAIEGFLRSWLDPDEKDDAYAIFCENVWKGLPAFRGQASLRTWLFRVAAHAAGRIRRDPYRRRARSLPPSSGQDALIASVSRFLPSSRHEALQVLIGELDDGERLLIALKVQNELEWEEVAAVLARGDDGALPGGEDPVSATALRKRFERLVRRLKARAQELGLVD